MDEPLVTVTRGDKTIVRIRHDQASRTTEAGSAGGSTGNKARYWRKDSRDRRYAVMKALSARWRSHRTAKAGQHGGRPDGLNHATGQRRA